MKTATILKAQYHASMAMLKSAIEQCPAEDNADLWYSGHERSGHRAPFWQIAFHVLFYTHLYLSSEEKTFEAWEHHRDEYQFLGNLPWPPHRPANIGEPYTKAEVLAYWQFVDGMVDDAVDGLDLEREECGFWWYDPMPKLEHQINNIRHVQHHAAQLADRLRPVIDAGVDWVGSAGREDG